MNKAEFQKAISGTQFEKDLKTPLKINNGDSSRGIWNLIVSIRDCKLYSVGLKPHRFWKISDVKKYFGIKGNAAEMAATLGKYNDFLKSEEGKAALS